MTFAHENNLKIANEYPDTALQGEVKTFDDKYRIEIFTHDQHIIDSIESLPEEDREKFLENALRIGIFAIYEAKGKIQKNVIGDEGEKLLKDLQFEIANDKVRKIGPVISKRIFNYYFFE